VCRFRTTLAIYAEYENSGDLFDNEDWKICERMSWLSRRLGILSLTMSRVN